MPTLLELDAEGEGKPQGLCYVASCWVAWWVGVDISVIVVEILVLNINV